MPNVNGDVKWGTPCATSDTVTIPPGTTSYQWSLTAPFGGLRWIYLEEFTDASGAHVASWGNDPNGSFDTSWTRSGSPPPGAAFICLRVWQGMGNSTPGAFSGSVSFSVGGATFCQYGTEPRAGTLPGTILTTGVIDAILGWSGLPAALAVIFDRFIGTVIDTVGLCAGPPATMPTFTNADFIVGLPNVVDPTSRAKWFTGLLVAAWPYFCECKVQSGSPAPINFPPPTVTLPPSAPPGPISFSCVETDLCSAFQSLLRQVTTMAQQVQSVASTVTLIQRQAVPFAYILGTVHSGLSGAGSIAVSGLLGARIQVTAEPSSVGQEGTTPPELFNLGYITWGTADGYPHSERIEHSTQLSMPLECSAFTSLSYDLTPGVTVSITELVREP